MSEKLPRAYDGLTPREKARNARGDREAARRARKKESLLDKLVKAVLDRQGDVFDSREYPSEH